MWGQQMKPLYVALLLPSPILLSLSFPLTLEIEPVLHEAR